jgi:predicted component of type VI protein secretion system
MSLQLVVIQGPDEGRTFTLQAGADLMLGRGAHLLYRLTDPRASRSHCQILLEGDRATVIDNESRGGTFVNGVRVELRALKLGDILEVGDTRLRLQMGDFPLDVALAALEGAAPPPPSVDPSALDRFSQLSGQTLAHYEIGPVIGQGHSAIVFHATDTKDQRSVALKVLLPQFARR